MNPTSQFFSCFGESSFTSWRPLLGTSPRNHIKAIPILHAFLVCSFAFLETCDTNLKARAADLSGGKRAGKEPKNAVENGTIHHFKVLH